MIDIFSKCELSKPNELISHLVTIMPVFKINDYMDELEWRVFSIMLKIENKFIPCPPPHSLLVENRIKPTYRILEFELTDIVDITFGPCCDNTIAENQFRKLFMIKGLAEDRINEIKFIESEKQYRDI